MFDEQDIVNAALRVSEKCTNGTLESAGMAFLAFAHELQRISEEKQKAWEKRHKFSDENAETVTGRIAR